MDIDVMVREIRETKSALEGISRRLEEMSAKVDDLGARLGPAPEEAPPPGPDEAAT